MSEKILVARGISKIFNIGQNNQITALKDVSLEVNKGEFVCVMGPPGSGKTTLINNLSSIDMPTNGSVIIDGENISLMDQGSLCDFRKNTLGFIFQTFNIVDSLTMFENIRVPLLLNNYTNEYIDNEIQKIGRELRIEKLLHKYPKECTNGQQQKVAFARALVTKPKIVIADEPTYNLDSNNSYEILEIVNRVNKQDISIVMVTHDPAIASFSSKVIYMKDGKISKVITRADMGQKEYHKKIEELCLEDNKKIIEELKALSN